MEKPFLQWSVCWECSERMHTILQCELRTACENGTENRRSQHRRSRAKKSMDLTFTMCPTELTAR